MFFISYEFSKNSCYTILVNRDSPDLDCYFEIMNNWYLLSVRSKKREVFLKYLDIAITQKQLQELILDIKIPPDSVYEDIVLINTDNFKDTYSRLKEVECFQSIERKPLPSAQVNRMLGIS